MKKKTVVAVCLLTAALAAAAAVLAANGVFSGRARVMAEFFVSADGSDAADGSRQHPFATVEKARDEVRKINGDMTGDIVVRILEGEYRLPRTLTFDERDGASNGFSVRYVGEGDAVLSGGETLSGFTLYDAEKDIYSVKVPRGVCFRQLYVNGEKMIRSDTEHGYKTRIVGATRFLSDGTPIPEWNNNRGGETLLQADYGELYLRSCEFPEFRNPQDVEIHILAAWTKSILRVDTVERDREVAVIRVQEPENSLIFNRMHPDIDGYSHMDTHAFAYYLENAYELIDWYGEWYLDQSASTLYIKAPENTDMTTAAATYPRLETLVKIESGNGGPIRGLSFEGLTFTCTNWTLPSEQGYVEVQAGMYASYCIFGTNDMGICRPPAAFYAADTQNLTVKNCTFTRAGAAGIDLNHATTSSLIRDNTVKDVAGNGIMVGQFAADENTDIHVVFAPEDETLICTGDRIVNNLVTEIGTEFEGSVGIAAGYPRDILIACNEVSYAPYTGISVGYGWSAEDNAMRHNRILNNEIHHTGAMLCDAGGIYTLSKQPGSVIAGNYIHDITLPDGADYATSGIYMDEQTAGFTVKNNVIWHAWGVGRNRNGENDYREKTIFIDNKRAPRTWWILLNAGRKKNFDIFSKLHYE